MTMLKRSIGAIIISFCGVARAIVGGTFAKDGEFPYQALIRDRGISGLCSGAVYDENWILTGASCCQSSSIAKMVVGVGGIYRDQFEGEEEIRNVSKIIVHEGYNNHQAYNDICLIKLAEPLIFTEFVQPIALPQSFEETPGNRNSVLTGWGSTSEYDNEMSNNLIKVEMPTIDDRICRILHYGSFTNVIQSEICAGDLDSGGKGPCLGDGGAPLVDAEENILIGLWSWGLGCGRRQWPPAFTQVSHFINWIRMTTENNSSRV